jgi:hypothetical protein
MRNRDENGQSWADIIDFLTMYPDARRQADAAARGDIRSDHVTSWPLQPYSVPKDETATVDNPV